MHEAYWCEDHDGHWTVYCDCGGIVLVYDDDAEVPCTCGKKYRARNEVEEI
jgi:hypothetical protein